jgi:addiction module RelB/DinJ family antitoxin
MTTKTITKTKVIQTRLDQDLVDRAAEILDYVGLSTSDIFRILLKKIVNTGEIPASLLSGKPYFNAEQSKLIDEALDNIERGEVYSFKSIEELEKFTDKL